MKICYNKLQKLMIDNQMKRQDLMRAAEITSYAATKINKNEPVSLEVLMRICQVFHCDIGDICEVILDEFLCLSQQDPVQVKHLHLLRGRFILFKNVAYNLNK